MRGGIALGREAEREGVALQPDEPLPPAVGGAQVVAHRQGVEELVGDHDRGAGRHILHAGVPGQGDAAALQRRALGSAQDGAGLDEVEAESVGEARHPAQDAERVAEQRAAAGAELDEVQPLRAAHRGPDRGHPGADELAEHLARLGRGGEIAAGAEGIAGEIVAEGGVAEAQGHVAVDADRPPVEDEGADLVAEPRHAGTLARSMFRRGRSA